MFALCFAVLFPRSRAGPRRLLHAQLQYLKPLVDVGCISAARDNEGVAVNARVLFACIELQRLAHLRVPFLGSVERVAQARAEALQGKEAPSGGPLPVSGGAPPTGERLASVSQRPEYDPGAEEEDEDDVDADADADADANADADAGGGGKGKGKGKGKAKAKAKTGPSDSAKRRARKERTTQQWQRAEEDGTVNISDPRYLINTCRPDPHQRMIENRLDKIRLGDRWKARPTGNVASNASKASAIISSTRTVPVRPSQTIRPMHTQDDLIIIEDDVFIHRGDT